MMKCYSELLLPNLPLLFIRFAQETELTLKDHETIQNLLVTAFPQYIEIFTLASFWGSHPTNRLWIETKRG